MTPPDSGNLHRWYDRDPVLRQALETLRNAPDRQQAQIALNIILIVVEHHIETETMNSVDELTNTLTKSRAMPYTGNRRWYDMNETMRSAMQLLKDCPDEVQRQIIPSVCAMIEDSLDAAF